MNTNFAPSHKRTDEGWVIFPKDTPMRKHLFPYTDPGEHIAKANMIMVAELVVFVSEKGETILDPFAGTGTIMVAATLERKVIMFELVETFCQTIELNTIGLKQSLPDVRDWVNCIQGNAASLLPVPDLCDHLIFSPPYPLGLKKKGIMDKTSVDLGYAHAVDYSEDEQNNFTNLNDFLYHQKIEEFYKKCLGTVRVGGTMTVIIKDKMKDGKRIMQADRTVRDCTRMGWELAARNKWLAMGGGYANINRSAGLQTVNDEDLLTFRRTV